MLQSTWVKGLGQALELLSASLFWPASTLGFPGPTPVLVTRRGEGEEGGQLLLVMIITRASVSDLELLGL